jgi:carbonic anhydrase
MKTLAKIIIPSLLGLSLSAAQAAPSGQAWNYAGPNGPSQWSTNFPACSRNMQSPINIPTGTKPNKGLPSLEFVFTPTPAKVIDTGHALQADMLNNSDTLTVGSAAYTLVQFHVHLPSENQLAGKSYPGEIHLVYKGKQDQLAVVGILIEPGKANATIAEFIHAAQNHQPVSVNADKAIRIKHGQHFQQAGAKQPQLVIDANDFLPSDSDTYYNFTGSLTTPPCTGSVIWYVLANPITASPAQLRALRAFHYNNVRPTQPVDSRKINYKPSEVSQGGN